MDASAAAGSATSAAAALAAGERLAAAAAVDSRRACSSPRAAISRLDRRARLPMLLEAAGRCSGLLARRVHCRAALAARERHALIASELLCIAWACAASIVQQGRR